MSKILNDIAELAKRIKTNPEAEERGEDEAFLTKRIERFPQYFSTVISMESRISILANLYEREDYIDKVMRMDQSRRDQHILATDAINQINVLCDLYGMEHIFQFPAIGNRKLQPEAKIKGNFLMEMAAKDDRELAADAIFEFCKEVFLESKDKERYNHMIGSRGERDMELHDMSKEGICFKHEISVDELISIAKQQIKSSDHAAKNNDDFVL